MLVRTIAGSLWQTQNLPKATDRKPKSAARNGPKALISDDLFLKCRALHEFEGWADWQLADKYSIDLRYMQRQVLGYETRVMLIPKPHDASIEIQ
jgi:hypothetical protein